MAHESNYYQCSSCGIVMATDTLHLLNGTGFWEEDMLTCGNQIPQWATSVLVAKSKAQFPPTFCVNCFVQGKKKCVITDERPQFLCVLLWAQILQQKMQK